MTTCDAVCVIGVVFDAVPFGNFDVIFKRHHKSNSVDDEIIRFAILPVVNTPYIPTIYVQIVC